MKTAVKIGILVMVLVYAVGLAFTYYSNDKFTQEFEYYDTDKNGVINGNEITKDSQLFLLQIESRKTTNQAMILLIPIAIFFGFMSFLITLLLKKMKHINAHEIHYGQ